MPKQKQYPVIVEKDENGTFILSCPLFDGCHTYGETMEEAVDNIVEVITLCEEEEDNDKRRNEFVEITTVKVPLTRARA